MDLAGWWCAERTRRDAERPMRDDDARIDVVPSFDPDDSYRRDGGPVGELGVRRGAAYVRLQDLPSWHAVVPYPALGFGETRWCDGTEARVAGPCHDRPCWERLPAVRCARLTDGPLERGTLLTGVVSLGLRLEYLPHPVARPLTDASGDYGLRDGEVAAHDGRGVHIRVAESVVRDRPLSYELPQRAWYVRRVFEPPPEDPIVIWDARTGVQHFEFSGFRFFSLLVPQL